MAFVCYLISPGSQAGTLIVVPSDENLVALQWTYREVSTRNWFGCWWWDVLQGAGWFPATWYQDIEPEVEDGTYSFTTRDNLHARYCNAQMDSTNRIRLAVHDEDETILLQGGFSVIPDGDSQEAVIRCVPTDTQDEWNSLACEDAHVAWANSRPIVVHIIWDELLRED